MHLTSVPVPFHSIDDVHITVVSNANELVYDCRSLCVARHAAPCTHIFIGHDDGDGDGDDDNDVQNSLCSFSIILSLHSLHSKARTYTRAHIIATLKVCSLHCSPREKTKG